MNVAAIIGGAVTLKLLYDHKSFVDKGKSFDSFIKKAADTYRISPHILRAVLWQESRFNPEATGSIGEVGMAQFREIALLDIQQNMGFTLATDISDLRDPETAIMAAAALLRLNQDRTDSIYTSIRAYNVGIGNAKKGISYGQSYLIDVLKNVGLNVIWETTNL